MPRDEREDDSLVNKLYAFQILTDDELSRIGTLRLLERCRERDKRAVDELKAVFHHCGDSAIDKHNKEWDELKERVLDLLDPFRKMSHQDLWG